MDDTFQSLYEAGQNQLAWRTMPADLDTPVSAWLKLCANEPFSFLLESIEGGATLGRYSILGLRPDLFWRCRNGKAETSIDHVAWRLEPGEALASLKAAVRDCRLAVRPPGLPPMAGSGLFGYLGYDMIRLVEAIPDANPDELGIPDGLMIRPTLIVIFDNVAGLIYLTTPVRPMRGVSAATAHQAAKSRLAAVEKEMHAQVPVPAARTSFATLPDVQANMTREAYHGLVRRAIDYIKAGEIFQVLPSQRFSVPFDLPPLALYRSLRRVNPSPFLFYLQFGDMALVGSSPEILVRVRDATVTIRPLAGTRPRGANPAADRALAEELLADPKERAEHLMLLDLGRNDVGRVAATGSVKVTQSFAIERYSHVMHIVSNVEGRLRVDIDPVDALFAGFPAGTVSGAPKIRAMQIIDELEPTRRGFYGGCIGYLDGNGDVDTCIALRTGLIKDGILHVQAGGGVVADSDPEAEYQETCNKARAVLRAAELAWREAAEVRS